ncbi:PTS glucose transporter subunit IIA [Serinibacter arcticus]|uniref:PTS glucose transporter subunit IIA n=1 Tax=Serinibacter arcticus TaxID=1655435 RepID=A0A2U1ZT71_9MICO|nr:glucose PTS transporter subunit IIA [Serinibacter arcticus]PWD50150.1 PTS glucose transporter subunit IIA [Serinibacter arcticus]
MAELLLLAPFDGAVLALGDVPDEVFASAMMGPGLALVPDGDAHLLEVLSPCDGTIAKMHPHAAALEATGGLGVLLHLGIDTVGLTGEGFTVHAADGDVVRAGQALVTWDLAVARAAGLSLVSPVVAMQADPAHVRALVEPGTRVAAGTPVLAVAIG